MNTATDVRASAPTDAATSREREIVAALRRLRPAGPDPDGRAHAKAALMLRLAATPVDRPVAHGAFLAG